MSPQFLLDTLSQYYLPAYKSAVRVEGVATLLSINLADQNSLPDEIQVREQRHHFAKINSKFNTSAT
jgi:hypothetical protein